MSAYSIDLKNVEIYMALNKELYKKWVFNGNYEHLKFVNKLTTYNSKEFYYEFVNEEGVYRLLKADTAYMSAKLDSILIINNCYLVKLKRKDNIINDVFYDTTKKQFHTSLLPLEMDY